MSWIKRLLGIKEPVSKGVPATQCPPDKCKPPVKEEPEFTIEHYPVTDRYYPKRKSYYLKNRYSTGIMEEMRPELFGYASYGETEKEARELIELFKEQRLKKNVKTIKY